MDYQNFDLAIEADGPIPVARTNSRNSPVRQDLNPVFPEGTSDEKATGDALFRWLFSGKICIAFRNALSERPQESPGLRIRLRLETDSVALNSLPWELLFDADRQRFLARDPATPLVRIRDGNHSVWQPVPAGGPLRILLASASPADRSPLQLQDELLRICNAVPGATFAICENATREKLQRLLNGEAFQVFHLMGHGGVINEKRLLALEKDDHNSDLLTPHDFIQLLPSHRYPLLTILNFCWSANTGASPEHAGFASSLVAAGLPAVLGLSMTINDRVAIELSQSLYRSLAEQRCIEEAVAFGRTCLKEKWSHPVLYMQGDAPNRLIAAAPVPLPAAAANANMVQKAPEAARIVHSSGIYIESAPDGNFYAGGK